MPYLNITILFVSVDECPVSISLQGFDDWEDSLSPASVSYFRRVYRYNKYISQQCRHVTNSSRGVVVVLKMPGHVHWDLTSLKNS